MSTSDLIAIADEMSERAAVEEESRLLTRATRLRVWASRVRQHRCAPATAALLRDALAALRPFARFAERFNAKPISQLHDSFYAIHTGTEWEAELRLSDLRAALELVQRAAEAGMGGEDRDFDFERKLQRAADLQDRERGDGWPPEDRG